MKNLLFLLLASVCALPLGAHDSAYDEQYRLGEQYYNGGMQNVALEHFLAAADNAATDREKYRVYYAIAISSTNIHEASAGIDPLRYFEMAERLARQAGDSTMVARSIFGRASMLCDFLGVHKTHGQAMPDSRRDSVMAAVGLLRQAERYARTMPVVRYALALSHAALGEGAAADRQIALLPASDADTAQGANVRASIMICRGRYAEAVATARRAYGIGEATENEADMRNSLHILYYAHKFAGNTALALEAFERFSEKQQRLMDESFDRQVNTAQVRFDTRLKEEQLAATERQNTLYRTGMGIIAATLVVVGALLAMVVSYFRRLRTAYEALVRSSIRWAGRPTTSSPGPSTPQPESPRNEADRREVIGKLEALMTGDRPYLRPELTIAEVAATLGINRSYLSDAVNRIHGIGFSVYLNELRVREAINIISGPDSGHFTVDALAQMSGFANRQTFHSAFVRTTGLTPSEFRRSRPAGPTLESPIE